MKSDFYSDAVNCWTIKQGFLEHPLSLPDKHSINESIYQNAQANLKPGDIYKNIIDTTVNLWLEEACEEAYQSVKAGGGPFGAIVAQLDEETGNVIRYWKASNKVTLLNDPTAHAEVLAIRSTCNSLGLFDLGRISAKESQMDQPGEYSKCIIYSSCEPCPMCYSAIYWARIPVLYFAATRFDAEVPGVDFSDASIYNDLKAPYNKRKIKVRQSSVSNSLDAFNLWKNTETKAY